MERQGALNGVRILDLSRVLAGPSCTQLLGDLGAEVIKIEQPLVGDETRTWGPPYIKDKSGCDTSESAYYASCNRNKKSITVNIAKPKGIGLVKRLLSSSDVLIENFKVGNLTKYGLSYNDLKHEFPKLIYCSITGYGQTGPYASRPGYDLLAQASGGLLSLTGDADRPPVKVPVAINDLMTGMYASVAILAALRHRDTSGFGQYIDLGLLDVQVAMLYNQGLNYLIGGTVPGRLGSGHPNVVPYQVFETQDGYIILGLNNDEQFKRFCKLVGRVDLIADDRFASNAARVQNREIVVSTIQKIVRSRASEYWLTELPRINVTSGDVKTVDQVFDDPQVKARNMKICMPYPSTEKGEVALIGNPIKFSRTPIRYDLRPPYLGEHTNAVLAERLGLDNTELTVLRTEGVI